MTSAPAWYADALADSPALSALDVDGTRIAVRLWGAPEGTPVVLVHGGAAHAAWWDHIAPLLTGCRVVAFDMSGHGDSDWRDAYRLALWRDEVMAVVRSGLVTGKPLLVGHSMGGYVGYEAARSNGDELAGLLLVDSLFPSRRADDSDGYRNVHRRRAYPDLETILGRFRVLPADEPRATYAVAHVARASVVESSEGWSWKFDPRIFDHDDILLEDIEPLADCPAIVMRGAAGLLTAADAELLASSIDGSSQSVTIVDCGHHVPLDQPVALAAAISTAAKRWARPA